MFIVVEAAAVTGSQSSLAATAAWAAGFGLVIATVFGLAQAWALPARALSNIRWTLANTVGWALALPFIFAAEFPGWSTRFVIWASGGFAAGGVVGLATGVAPYVHPAEKPARR